MGSQKVAVVTGGMGGLGEAICRALFKRNYRVVTTFSPTNQHAAGFEFSAYMIDVTDFSSCELGVRTKWPRWWRFLRRPRLAS